MDNPPFPASSRLQGSIVSGLATAAGAGILITTFLHRISLEVGGTLHDHLPLVWALQDSSLFTRDVFMQAFSRQPTGYWHLLAWIIPTGSEASGLFIWGPLGLIALYILGMGALAAGLSRCPAVWMATMILGAGMGEALLGSNFLTSNQLSPTVAVTGPLLAALGLGAAGYYGAAMAVVGVCANFHLLNAFYVGVMLAGAMALRCRTPKEWLRAARAFGFAVAAAAPVLIQAVRMARTGPPPVGWAEIIQGSHYIHYYAFTQDSLLQMKTLAVVLAMLGLLLAHWRGDFRATRFLAGCLLAWGVFFLGLGSLLTDVLAVPLFIRLQPLRATSWLVPLTLIFFAKTFFEGRQTLSGRDESVTKNGARSGEAGGLSPRQAFAFLACAQYLFYLNLMRPHQSMTGIYFVPVFLVAAIISLVPRRIPRLADRLLAALAMGLLAAPWLLILCTLVLALYPEQTLGLVILANWRYFGVLILGAAAVGYLLLDRLPAAPAWQRCSFAVILGAFALLVLYGLGIARVLSGQGLWTIPPSDPEWVAACRWMRANTPPDALVQGPPASQGLRTFARRNSFFELNDDGALYMEPSILALLEKRSRMVASPMVKEYGSTPEWDPGRIRWDWLARHEGLTHAVVPVPHVVPGTLLYNNSGYSIYKLSKE